MESSFGDPELIEAIDGHISKHIGPVHLVFHEIVPAEVHIDVHHVASSPGRPFEVLVTSGMSERPMITPPEASEFSFAEVVALLPAGWPLTHEDFKDERNYWPVRMLKLLARYPHEGRTWIGPGHTIAGPGEPPAAFAEGTALSSVMLLPPPSLPEQFRVLDGPAGRRINFYVAVPLYWEELQLKLRDGSDALLERLDDAGVADVIDPVRPNAGRRKRWLGWF